MADDPRPVFVYGTLTEPARVDAVLDDWRYDDEAVLEGCHRVEGEYPTLAPGGTVGGRLLVTPDLEALDAYERVPGGRYVRVAVPVEGGSPAAGAAPGTGGGSAWCYVGDPDRLGAPAAWPGEGSFAERVRAGLERVGATVRRRNR